MRSFVALQARRFVGAGLLLSCAVLPASADPIEDFYRGKQIDMVIGYSPGGTYDLYARLVGRFLGDFIPGKPKIVPRNMPGAGSRLAANWVYNIAPKDGTVIATADQSLAIEQAMGDKGLTIDTSKFNYIGNPNADNNTTVTWYTSGVKTIDDAKKMDVPMGATGGSTSSQYPKAMNALLGTRFQVITGYPGGNDVSLAMEKGEVMGRGSNAWGAWKSTRPDWLRDKKINILVQIGLQRAPDLPDVPLMFELAKNEEDRQVLTFMSADMGISRAFVTTYDVPPARLEALRNAFDKMIQDPEFLAEAEKMKMDINPSTGLEAQKVAESMLFMPANIVQRAKVLFEPGK